MYIIKNIIKYTISYSNSLSIVFHLRNWMNFSFKEVDLQLVFTVIDHFKLLGSRSVQFTELCKPLLYSNDRDLVSITVPLYFKKTFGETLSMYSVTVKRTFVSNFLHLTFPWKTPFLRFFLFLTVTFVMKMLAVTATSNNIYSRVHQFFRWKSSTPPCSDNPRRPQKWKRKKF